MSAYLLKTGSAIVLAFVIHVLLPRTAQAGWDTAHVLLVNLDEDPKSKRFKKLKKAMDRATAANRSHEYGVIGAKVVERASVAGMLGQGCALSAKASDEYTKLLAQHRAQSLLLYCATADASRIDVVYYAGTPDRPVLMLEFHPKGGQVGQPLLNDIAKVVARVGDLYFEV